MNALGLIFRYIQLKKMSPADRKRLVPRLSVFAGKAAPGYHIAKLIIKLVNAISKTINADKDIREYLTVAFLPDYAVSLAQILVPAADVHEHISTSGTEASGTSCMKFALNGGLLLGTLDGANIEIAEAVGDENVFFFGHLTPDVPKLRRAHHFGESQYPAELLEVIDEIRAGTFGESGVFEPLISTLFEGKDHYLVSDDFLSYLQAQKMVDEAFVDQDGWVEKCSTSAFPRSSWRICAPLADRCPLASQSIRRLAWASSRPTARRHSVSPPVRSPCGRAGSTDSGLTSLTDAEEIWNVEPIKVTK